MELPEKELEGRRVLCGFSGGADSLFLLLFLHTHAAAGKFSLEAVHFNHHFRGKESDGDEEFCHRICLRESIPFHAVPLHVPDYRRPGEGDEEASRRLRLAAWKQLADDRTVIALAHHAGDLTENLLLRLCRGSNAGGLVSLRKFSEVDGLLFYRPLLGMHRAEIIRSLEERGEVWRTDSTNLNNDYARNHIRNILLPGLKEKIPFAEKGILRSAEVLAEDADFLQLAAEQAWKDGPAWNNLHSALLPRVLRLFLREKTGTDYIPSHDFCHEFSRMLSGIPSSIRTLTVPGLEQYRFLFRKGSQPVLEKLHSAPEKIVWKWKETPSVTFGDFVFERSDGPCPAEQIPANEIRVPLRDLPETLILRARNTGDRLPAEGHRSPVSVSKLLSDAKVPPDRRKHYPVLTLPDGTLLWLPGVRRRTGLLPENTGECLRIIMHL